MRHTKTVQLFVNKLRNLNKTLCDCVDNLECAGYLVQFVPIDDTPNEAPFSRRGERYAAEIRILQLEAMIAGQIAE